MRGRVRVFSIIAILTVILAVSAVFASGAIAPPKLNTLDLVQPNSPGTTVFVDPNLIIKDYINNPGYQVGNKFYVNINVTEMTDLFTWQLNLTWNKAILNFTKRVVYGDFLYRTTSPDKTSRTVPIVGGSNASGYGWVAETILGNYAGISGAGRLVSLEFLVVGYGCSTFTISTSGSLPTQMLNSAGTAISFTTTNGYFKNKLNGDSNGDKTVNILDMGTLSGRWTGAPGALPYSRDVDNNDDGVINILDMGITSGNWGRTAP